MIDRNMTPEQRIKRLSELSQKDNLTTDEYFEKTELVFWLQARILQNVTSRA